MEQVSKCQGKLSVESFISYLAGESWQAKLHSFPFFV